MRKPFQSFRRLRHETLEDRRLLATDLAQIAGVVTNDLNGDGTGTALVSGVGVELFLDDGDNVFDAGDTSQGTTTTNGSGAYNFDNLEAGSYFVRITPVTGQQTRTNGNVSSIITFNTTEAAGSTNLTIDDFTAVQSVTATRSAMDVGTVSNSAVVDAGSIEGGELDLLVEVTSAVGDVRARSGFNNGSTMVLKLSSDSGVNGRMIATWDGDDNDGATVDHGNLSLDLSNGGVNSAFALNIAADQTAGTLILRAFSGAGNVSEASIDLTNVDTDGTINGTAGEEISVLFAGALPDFSATSGAGANFSNITALQLELDFTGSGENGLDAEIEMLGVVGFTTKTADFIVLNEMSLGDQVWIDLDNDGVFEAGEVGVAGVAITLFEDTDGDDDYTDETPLQTALTDASGNYLFEGLFPSDYIVQIDEVNFDPGGVLEGLATSTGNDTSGMAPDPDTADDNNTDKGTLQGDDSVVSKAVTLIGNTEPTNDGDSDNNTNRTLDFGFFGFDVTITKQVDQSTASPDDTLVYTVVVTNDGPSTATGVDLTDTLPTGVTFVSGTTTVGGQSVAGSGGSQTVTSTIGTLTNGQSATITITATIDTATTGTLTNTVVTSATNESNTTNNTATAQTVIQPEIDLAITKVDNDNDLTLAPTDSISYTLNARNNGPSDATGVTVIDVLPTGLTFNATGSTAPTSTVAVAGGTQLTYSLGALANDGSSTNIIINADISSTFTGTLTNTATISGNETEMTTVNNSASAQSVVAITPATISGNVYFDADNDGVFDSGEQPIAGVLLTLTGTDFNQVAVSQTTTTNANGFYEFTNLNPGTYQVAETQPTFFTDGQDTATYPGATAGADVISTITLGAGDDAQANNFGELAPTLSKRRFLASQVG